MVHSLLIALTALLGQAGPQDEFDKINRGRIREYYTGWVGVRAPELGRFGRDHDDKPVPLAPFRGKRVLLFSFDAGNFNRAPDEATLFATLRALDKARQTAGRDKLAVVGFTQGMAFVWPGAPKPDGELGRLSDFPIVSAITSIHRKFNEPYNLLLQPSAILIDGQGILRAFYDHPMSERELLDAAALGDWDKPVRPAPVDDPWSGKGPPRPTHEAAVAWSQTITSPVAGMTRGDWDLRGSEDLIAGAEGALIVIDPENGKERHKFPCKDISSHGAVALSWAKVGKEQSAVFVTRGGWPRTLPVIGRDGAPLWTLGEFAAGIDSVAWADLDGAGSSTLIVGLNGGGGLRAFRDGRERWGLVPQGSIWAVAGIDAAGERPGRIIYTDGGNLSVLDPEGNNVGAISTDGHGTTILAAAEMNDAGERQVVSIWPAVVGTADYAVATDLHGKVLWKYPVNYNQISLWHTAILAVDVTGDGTKEWLLAPTLREVVVVDLRGRLVARIKADDEGWIVAWTAIARKGQPGWIGTVEPGKLSALTLSVKN